ncbi:MAG: hypothetical protein M0017_02250 [Desulfobacteraceae bacterium]|nr:hypothetical protein [Desulfobacteraceae bacterium]
MATKRPKKKSRHQLRKPPFLFLLLFVMLGMAGIIADEPLRVLEQARQVCLSCIGIG